MSVSVISKVTQAELWISSCLYLQYGKGLCDKMKEFLYC